MTLFRKIFISIFAFTCVALSINAQQPATIERMLNLPPIVNAPAQNIFDSIEVQRVDTLRANVLQAFGHANAEPATIVITEKQPVVIVQNTANNNRLFLPVMFKGFEPKNQDIFIQEYSGEPAFRWIEEQQAISNSNERIIRQFILNRPDLVQYNVFTLPEPPQKYDMRIDPKDHTIKISKLEQSTTDKMAGMTFKKTHWIKTFTSSIQFSQAYVSPNWYQGGNNNLNALISLYYNVKLNTNYHKNLLFESTFQYKLGLNSAPDDSLRNYSISEDLLQINTTFGVKAAKRWYYSLTAQFKTQVVNSYTSNTYTLRSAFLSPADLTAGLGMTYNYANTKKTFSFDASMAPLSYNLKTCTNKQIDPTSFSIDEGHTTKMTFGSSLECKMTWQMTNNISLSSRIFAFTDYNYAQADWENTLSMAINRYLTTQIYVHARYDTTTPRIENEPNWHKLQVKEILSFGIAYSFKTI
jgi:hypothetical protein